MVGQGERRVPDPRIAATLRSYRGDKGLSIRKLAAAAGLNWSTVSKVEAGERTIGAYGISRLSTVLGKKFQNEMLAIVGEKE